jgi:hypothetical protein
MVDALVFFASVACYSNTILCRQVSIKVMFKTVGLPVSLSFDKRRPNSAI